MAVLLPALNNHELWNKSISKRKIRNSVDNSEKENYIEFVKERQLKLNMISNLHFKKLSFKKTKEENQIKF